ncbi:MAG: LON peptidase substrate-binding domain-containing protein [Pseudomonadota bacterium]
MIVEPRPRFQVELPQTIPIFPLSGALLMPGAQLPLNIFEPRYLRMVDDALAGARAIGMIQPKHEASTDAKELYSVGCAGRLTTFAETGDGRYLITLTGVRRFRLLTEINADTPYRVAEVDWAAFDIDEHPDKTIDAVDRDALIAAMRDYLDAEGLKADWDAAEEAPTEALVVSLAMGCPFAPNEKQALLEAQTIADQAACLMALMEMAGGDSDDGAGALQ